MRLKRMSMEQMDKLCIEQHPSYDFRLLRVRCNSHSEPCLDDNDADSVSTQSNDEYADC